MNQFLTIYEIDECQVISADHKGKNKKMADSFSKKEQKNKKAKAKQEKAEKMRERKANKEKGKTLEDMLAYIDENGNLSAVPVEPGQRKEIPLSDIQLGAAARLPEETVRTGIVNFFSQSKGYGFITDDKSGTSVFFHLNQLLQPVQEKDKVTFEWERTARGYSALNVTKAGSTR